MKEVIDERLPIGVSVWVSDAPISNDECDEIYREVMSGVQRNNLEPLQTAHYKILFSRTSGFKKSTPGWSEYDLHGVACNIALRVQENMTLRA
ncbi:MAG: hypothetical protein IPK76_27150 [Lewinellaceae bacterium]|nr:hypothetical protein [Lewinellaceae bacterium]